MHIDSGKCTQKCALGYMENAMKEKTNKRNQQTEKKRTPQVRKKAIHTGSKTFPLSVWIGLPRKCRENENKIISVQFFYFISAIFIVYLFLFCCGRCCCGWCCFCFCFSRCVFFSLYLCSQFHSFGVNLTCHFEKKEVHGMAKGYEKRKFMLRKTESRRKKIA